MDFKVNLIRDKLVIISVLYIVLPYYLFFISWLRIEYAIVLTLLFSFFVIKMIVQNKTEEKGTWNKKIQVKPFILILVFAFAIVLLSGIGGIAHQRGDYYKHNLLYLDLVGQNWPVIYNINGLKNDFLCYNIAYYLPSSLFAKALSTVFSIKIAVSISSVLWSWTGVFIVFYWIYRYCQNKLWAVFIFLFLFGLSSVYILYHKFIHVNNDFVRNIDGFSFYMGQNKQLDNPHNIAHLAWAPQHCIGGWIITSLVLNQMKQSKLHFILFIHSLSIFWSVFVFIGLVPFTLYSIIQLKRKNLFSLTNIVGSFILIVPFILYYTSHYDLEYIGFIFDFPPKINYISNYLNFVFFEYILSAIFIILFLNKSIFRKDLILTLLFFASFCSMFFIGRFNDLVMRAGIPATFFLSIAVIRVLIKLKTIKKTTSHYIFLILILIGSWIPVKEVYRSFVPVKDSILLKYKPVSIFDLNKNYSIVSLNNYYSDVCKTTLNFNASIQYLGKQNSIFYQYLLKTNEKDVDFK